MSLLKFYYKKLTRLYIIIFSWCDDIGALLHIIEWDFFFWSGVTWYSSTKPEEEVNLSKIKRKSLYTDLKS